MRLCLSNSFSYSFRCFAFSLVFLLLFLAVALIPSVAFSENSASQEDRQTQQDENIQTMEPVVVSATKTPVPISHLTSAVEVITEEDLQRRKLKTVIDALRLSQGLTAFSTGGPGSGATVQIRGGNARQTHVFIDGAVMNSATLGSFNFANLTTDNIEKIEILRGAQSMLWGTDAIGGVINITTKRGTGKPRVNAFFEYGSFLSIREGASASGQQGPVDFTMSLSRWDFTGFSAVDFRLGAIERDSFRNWQASSKMGVSLPWEARLEFNFRWLNGDTNLDNSVGPSDVFKSKNRSNQFVFGGNYQQPITDWWSQKITLSRQEERFAFDPGILQRNLTTGVFSVPFGSPSLTTTSANRIEWQHDIQIGKPLLLTMGYQFREQEGENSSNFPNKIISSHAGFAQAQLNLWDRIFATAGVRQDSFNIFGDATTYRVTAGYLHKETGTKIRGSYATGFRAPTLNDLFFPNFSNPTLGPEKSQGLDLGVDQYLMNKRLQLSVGYFWNRFRDQIIFLTNAPSCAPFSTFLSCPQNVGSTKSQGWELAFRYSIFKDLPFFKNLELRGQYTYTLTRDNETGARLPRWPVHQWSGVLNYHPIEPLLLTLSWRHVGARFSNDNNQNPLNSFDIFTLIATYQVMEQMEAYTRVENLGNERYEEIQFFGTPIRSIYGGIRMNFDVPLPFSGANGTP